MLRHQVRQARAIDLAGRSLLVLRCPARERQRIFRSGADPDAPLVNQAPRFAALARRAFLQQEARILEDLLPEVLLLRRGEEKRQLLAKVRVERVLPQPLDEGAERQDVGRFPDREALRDLVRVEFAL